MKYFAQIAIFALCCCAALLCCCGIAQPTETTDHAWAVDETRRLLQKQDGLPWYDPATDTVRPVEVTPFPDDAHRRSSWTTTPSRRKTKKMQISWLQVFWEIMQWGMRAALVILLFGILALLVRAVLRMERKVSADLSSQNTPATVNEFDQLENLPVPVDKIDGNLLDTARRYRDAGDYGQAIVYLFAYMLIELDKHHIIRLMRGKTNRQYMSEIGWHSPLAFLLRPTMIAFEDSFFGHHEISRSRLDACWNGLQQFHGQLEQSD